MTHKIIYTKVDEAPALATRSLLPILKQYLKHADVEMETRDISLAGRILANFPEKLTDEQKVTDDLTYLGNLTQCPTANIIKLPNISASIPQLKAAIKELQEKGYDIPNYPENPTNEDEERLKERFSVVLGSAVNPVLREGNSDRRAPGAVKNYAKKFPHSMGKWEKDSKTHVATMDHGNFRWNEKSTTMEEATDVKIEFVSDNGETTVLKRNVSLEKGEIVDSTFMSKKALVDFLEKEMEDAKEKDILFSLHMKATMMKVSDPVIFGYCVEVFFKKLITKHSHLFDRLGVNFSNGFNDLYQKMADLPAAQQAEIEADIAEIYKQRPDLAMVDSAIGKTNLHIPSDIIIDASMPAMIRNSGQMWNKDGNPQDTKAVIPDSSYASLYRVTIEDCIENGAFDPTTMGTVQNVGLMAKKAEEYGSHPTTFKIPGNGTVKVVDTKGNIVHEAKVEKGDIWRMVMVKDIPIQDWVKLAVNRARAMKCPAIFWLNEKRAHDAEVIKKVNLYLKDHDTTGLDIRIMNVADATKFSIDRMRQGLDTISVTGNVLRDYNTDLFPIMELGTSAKMLSIVPLMKGGGLFETGAGGSAPKHVQQLIKENHLRWDSLGEFLALAASLEHLAKSENNPRAQVFATALDKATGRLLENDKSPKRKCGELDNRGSHFYLAMYWAKELAEQNEDKELKDIFTKIAKELADNEETIVNELNSVQGNATDLGGYYRADNCKTNKVMRPSQTLNKIIDNM